jgi:hypothetical protein
VVVAVVTMVVLVVVLVVIAHRFLVSHLVVELLPSPL